MSNYNSVHTGQEIDNLTTASNIINLIYPVGSIYISVNSANPTTLFGGTWEQITGRFLLGSSDTYTAGSTGGEATHTLTIEEMPRHIHTTYGMYPRINEDLGGTKYGHTTEQSWWFQSVADAVKSTGGSQPHNNMPPYLAVNIWKRIA